VTVALGTLQEEQVTEFRAGTVNDLLVAAKGGSTPAAGDAKRWKSLAMGGGVSSAVLALALVVVLITGTGSKSSNKTTTTTAPVALLDRPANTFDAQPFTINETQAPPGISRGDTVTLAGASSADGSPLTITNVFVRGISTQTSASPVAGQPKVTTKTYQLAIPLAEQQQYLQLSPKNRQLLGGSAPATTAPPSTTAPPATQPATTPPSS
jgi:hypothetical protein